MTATIVPVQASDHVGADVENDAGVEIVDAPVATRAAAREAHGRPAQPTFTFDGGAADWLGVCVVAFIVTVLTLGICYPWALVRTYRWKAHHTLIDGQRLRFTGTATGLFGRWLGWLALTVLTLGIYSFWVYPRLTRWIVEHQDVDPER